MTLMTPVTEPVVITTNRARARPPLTTEWKFEQPKHSEHSIYRFVAGMHEGVTCQVTESCNLARLSCTEAERHRTSAHRTGGVNKWHSALSYAVPGFGQKASG